MTAAAEAQASLRPHIVSVLSHGVRAEVGSSAQLSWVQLPAQPRKQRACREAQARGLDRDLARGSAESGVRGRGHSPGPNNVTGIGVGGRGRSPGLTRCAGGIAVCGLSTVAGAAGGMLYRRRSAAERALLAASASAALRAGGGVSPTSPPFCTARRSASNHACSDARARLAIRNGRLRGPSPPSVTASVS